VLCTDYFYYYFIHFLYPWCYYYDYYYYYYVGCGPVDISSNLLLQSLMRPLSASEQQTMNQLSLATQPPQQSSTTTIRLNPLYGGAPLGPQPLSKDHLVRLAVLEAAYRHLPHPSDSERLR